MSDVLFRAKNIDWKEEPEKSTIYNPKRWYKGYYVKGLVDYIIEKPCEVSFNSIREFTIQGFTAIDPRTLCRYIGKTDFQHEDIFENDIVEIEGGIKGVVHIGEYIHQNDTQIGVYINFIDKEKTKYLRQDFAFWWKRGLTVIGDVWDDPELLEVE